MHLTDHVTDVQLNEYLDNETTERAQIEAHLASCDECAARLAALKSLFAEIESLPEIELTQSIAARITPTPSLPAQLPRWLTLTVTLQAVGALVAIGFAIPMIAQYLAPVLQIMPTVNEIAVELQGYLMRWIQSMQSFQLPSIPTGIFALPKEISPAMLSISFFGIFLIWLIGNWWLLRKRPNLSA